MKPEFQFILTKNKTNTISLPSGKVLAEFPSTVDMEPAIHAFMEGYALALGSYDVVVTINEEVTA